MSKQTKIPNVEQVPATAGNSTSKTYNPSDIQQKPTNKKISRQSAKVEKLKKISKSIRLPGNMAAVALIETISDLQPEATNEKAAENDLKINRVKLRTLEIADTTMGMLDLLQKNAFELKKGETDISNPQIKPQKQND